MSEIKVLAVVFSGDARRIYLSVHSGCWQNLVLKFYYFQMTQVSTNIFP